MRYNKYLIASLLLACFLAACGGGGGSGSNALNTPTDQPTESNPIKSNPAESTPAKSTTFPSISISTVNLNSQNSVVAGQSFIINVVSNNGASGEVTFTNGINTPGSITYVPASCKLEAGSLCSTMVNVGLPTSATEESQQYTANIAINNNNVKNPNQTVNFSVTKPKLEVIKQPEDIVVGYATNVGFSIESSSIPYGSGTVTLKLSPTNGLVDLLTLSSNECQIKYLSHQIVENGCANISVQSPGQLTGTTAITANAEDFASISSNKFSIEPSTKPTIAITSSLPSGSMASIVAGHSFTLTATSINGSSGELTFNVSDPGIKLNQSTCTVNPGGSCIVTAKVILGTPANIHNIIIDYKSGVADVLLTKYQFQSQTPTLEIITQPAVSSLYVGALMNAGFSIPESSIPDGSGTIKVNVTSNPSGIFQSGSCSIIYADNKIIDNKCNNIVFNAKTDGISVIAAKADDFIGVNLNPILVAHKFVYVLSSNQIIMYGQFSNGTIAAIPNYQPVYTLGNSASMAITPNGSYIYVVDGVANKVVPYFANLMNGSLLKLDGYSANTGKNPTAISISPNGNFAYVVNSGSNTVSEYSVDMDTGGLVPNKTPTVATGNQPYGVAISPNGLYAYVSNTGSSSVSSYSIGQGKGYLKNEILLVTNPKFANLLNKPTNLAIGPTGQNLLVQNSGSVSLMHLCTAQGQQLCNIDNNLYSNLTLNGVYFNPVTLADGSELGYTTSTAGVILYQISANGNWSNLGSVSWGYNQTGPSSMAFDQSGKYVYVGHINSNSISTYQIDTSTTGSMSLINNVGSTVPPIGIVVSPKTQPIS